MTDPQVRAGTREGIDRDTALGLYRTMLSIRHMESTVGELFAAGKLPGFVHLSIGQEAVAAGVCAALDDRDYLATTHRGHGHTIAKGGRMLAMMAELYGREEGYSLGRSGSMHIADSGKGILGANGIVAGGVPMAVGAAYAAQIEGEGRVSVSFFGEGAVAEGVMHECLNLAQLWRLPVLFVCEHNGYAEMTPVTAHLANPRVTELAAAYGMPSASIDGNDVGSVLETTRELLAKVRAGEGPALLEARTTRWRGHFEGDPQRYRPREELEAMTARDPLKAWASRLQEQHGFTEEELDRLDAEIHAEVVAAAEQAEAMAPSDPQGLTRFVYSEAVS